jgi:hypothetical protein
MTTSDKINLLLGTCGVEVANSAAAYVDVWRRSFRSSSDRRPGLKFAFLQADTVEDLLVDLITKDLGGGPLSAWLKDSNDGFVSKIPVAMDYAITLDFYVDMFSLELRVSRRFLSTERSKSDSVTVRFAPPPPPLDIPLPPRLSEQYIASSDLIRRLNEKNLVGWGACL